MKLLGEMTIHLLETGFQGPTTTPHPGPDPDISQHLSTVEEFRDMLRSVKSMPENVEKCRD